MPSLLRGRPAAGLLALTLAASLGVLSGSPAGTSGSGAFSRVTSLGDPCPPGQIREHEEGEEAEAATRATGERDADSEESREAAEKEREESREAAEEREREGEGAGADAGECRGAVHPESFHELSVLNGQAATRDAAPYGVRPAAFAAGSAQAAALAAQGTATTATWKPLGTTPLIADGADFGEVNTLGLADLAGRVEDYAYVPGQDGHWFAALANGGIHETKDAGRTWRSIGDNLPTQILGTVAYDQGRVIVGTGDPAFGGDSLAGLGAFYSDDDGGTWKRATGVPSGALSFQLAVDPSSPTTVYLATSKGLYRSTDRGATFGNVGLPTTCTSTTDDACFFANIVTDVVVQAAGGPGGAKAGGAVLAAVGWRAGQALNSAGKPQAPQNGLYTSGDGKPGSFTYVDPADTGVPNITGTGFPATRFIGRTALGIANGPTQDHAYVYALVEDAEKFDGNAGSLDVNDGGLSGGLAAGGTVLNGVFGSADFGRTWTKLADADALKSPAGQSALVGASTATYAPGVQSWYNEWIAPDPSPALTDSAGAPMHMAFGLEEVWQNTVDERDVLSPIVILQPTSLQGSVPLRVQPVQTTQFQVVGRYFGGTSCYGLNASLPAPCTTSLRYPNSTTTHPDQHAGLFVPDADGEGRTLLVGNDGGAYAQHTTGTTLPHQDGWGRGRQGSGSGILHTLLPYDAQMAKDGTVYAGLQDNGELKITPDGKQYEVFGGDAFYTAVDPDNSKIAYEEYTNGAVSLTTDGGKTFTSIDPGLTSALFATPLAMDPRDAKHLVIGGRDIQETTAGPKTNFSSDGVTYDEGTQWEPVFDLGTRTHPGDPDATADTSDPDNGDPDNSMSAVDVDGANVYAAYCGACDIVTGTRPFGSGLATNVGGTKPPKSKTGDGWHIAKAQGLPLRYIESVKMDPADPRTVYAAVGGYGRRWVPPGALADDVSKVGDGHLFVSHDAGETFSDVSGNLPDLPANWVTLFQGKVLVATDNGVFSTPVSSVPKAGATTASASVVPAAFTRTGTRTAAAATPAPIFTSFAAGLPSAPVFHLSPSPRNAGELVAASYGRGVYTLVLPGFEPKPVSPAPTGPAPGSGAGSGSGSDDDGSGDGSGGTGPGGSGTGGTGSGSGGSGSGSSSGTRNSPQARAGGSSLAATGLPIGLAAGALLLVGAGLFVRRRLAVGAPPR